MLQRRKYQPRPSVSDVALFVPTASGEPLAVGTDTTALDQLPDLGHNLTGRHIHSKPARKPGQRRCKKIVLAALTCDYPTALVILAVTPAMQAAV